MTVTLAEAIGSLNAQIKRLEFENSILLGTINDADFAKIKDRLEAVATASDVEIMKEGTDW